jgi:UDP-N-acetylglucosamine transferase subunit ALG13
MAQTVVVSAGSYHLPFERLVSWMEPWVASHPAVQVTMQHGPSHPLAGASNHVILPYADLMELCRAADAVVLQGGAGGVMDMRAIGRIPIVVPRVPVDDEVVDRHQLIFSDRVATLGVVRRATTREELWALIDGMLEGTVPTRAPAPEPTPGVARAVEVLGELPDRLPWSRRLARVIRSVMGVLRRR